jgi:hypothetical protein
MKIIIIVNLYLEIGIINGKIGYVKIFHFQNDIEWNMIIKYLRLLCFNERIKKHETLQDTTFKGLLKNVIPIISITRKLQYE